MTETTFDQPEPEERRPYDAAPWQALGFSSAAGWTWWKHRIDPGDALRWQRAGVTTPIDAVRWKIAGLDADTVREWIDAEIDAREAVAWKELGFNVREARTHKRAGHSPVQAYGKSPRPMRASSQGVVVGNGPDAHRFIQAIGRRDPRLVHSYIQRQWLDDEAIAWASHGVEATEALAWKELGLTPVEAERQQKQGHSAMQTAKAWWQMGIPFEEVADWIGAGLTAEEAAAQRASGVTVEQAAVLRSLRKEK